LSDFVQCLGPEFFELLGRARLDVDQGDVVTRIGERDRDAAAHAAGAQAGDRGARGHGLKPSRNSFCNWPRSSPPRPRLASVRPFFMKSSPQIAPPMARKDFASGVATPANSATETRNDRPSRRSSRM